MYLWSEIRVEEIFRFFCPVGPKKNRAAFALRDGSPFHDLVVYPKNGNSRLS